MKVVWLWYRSIWNITVRKMYKEEWKSSGHQANCNSSNSSLFYLIISPHDCKFFNLGGPTPVEKLVRCFQSTWMDFKLWPTCIFSHRIPSIHLIHEFPDTTSVYVQHQIETEYQFLLQTRQFPYIKNSLEPTNFAPLLQILYLYFPTVYHLVTPAKIILGTSVLLMKGVAW